MQAVYNKAFIEGRIYDVIEYGAPIFDYSGDALAMKIGNYVLPVRYTSININKPGVYVVNGMWMYPVYPTNPQDMDTYNVNHLAYFVSAQTFQDVVAAKEQLERDQYNHLVTSDKVFTPSIDDINDTPLIRGLKMAVTDKKCDINRYSEKFGPDFNNDRRKFNGHDITAAKYASISKNLDIRTTLIIEDMNPNVANPIGKKIILTWVGDGENDTAKEAEYREAICNSNASLEDMFEALEDDPDIEVVHF
jgi:hypothetical protein